MKKLLLFIFAATILISCQKEPQANFTTDKQTYTGGETVYLSNTSLDGDHYVWIVSDGQMSTSKNMVYTTNQYSYGESVSFELIAYSKNGKKTDEITKSITVNAANGTAIFWQSSGSYITTVTIGVISQDITANYATTPDCGTSGCANFTNISYGDYSFSATDGTYNWNGTITIYPGLCSPMQLTYKDAVKCEKQGVVRKK